MKITSARITIIDPNEQFIVSYSDGSKTIRAKVKFCLECETLKELVKNLEAQVETLKEDGADKDHTIKSLREGVKIGKGVVR